MDPVGSSTLVPPQTPHPPTRAAPKSDYDKVSEILTLIRGLNLSFPRFLKLIFTVDKGQGNKVSSSFLNSSPKPIHIDDILTQIYEHRFSSPRIARPGGGNAGPAADATEEDAVGTNNWARYQMQQWAVNVVSSMCAGEAEALMSTKDNPLRLTRQTLSWAILNGWNVDRLRKYIETHAPTTWRLFSDIAHKGDKTAAIRTSELVHNFNCSCR